jgi:hypothetical protein
MISVCACVCVRACTHLRLSLHMFLDIIFNLSNQSHMHWNVNTTDTKFYTCFGTSWVPLRANSKDTNVTCLRTPWWWHSRNAETLRLCIYCVHISLHEKLFDELNVAPCTISIILKKYIELKSMDSYITKYCQGTSVYHRISVSRLSAVKH